MRSFLLRLRFAVISGWKAFNSVEKLEIGGFYETRDGQAVVGPIEGTHNKTWPFKVGKKWYCNDGRVLAGRMQEDDLVMRVK